MYCPFYFVDARHEDFPRSPSRRVPHQQAGGSPDLSLILLMTRKSVVPRQRARTFYAGPVILFFGGDSDSGDTTVLGKQGNREMQFAWRGCGSCLCLCLCLWCSVLRFAVCGSAVLGSSVRCLRFCGARFVGSQFVAYSSQFAVRGSRFTVHASLFPGRGYFIGEWE